MLFHSAMLSDVTLTNASVELIASSEPRKHHDAKGEVTISWDSKMSEMLDKLLEHTSNDEALPQTSDTAINFRRKAVEMA